MQEITDLMRIKYGISKAPKSLTFKPNDSVHAQWMKTARWLGRTGLENGDYGRKEEMEAAERYLADSVRDSEDTVTLYPVEFDAATNTFLKREFKLKEGKKGENALKGHVYVAKQHLEKVDRDAYSLVMIDPTNRSLGLHGKYSTFFGGTPRIVVEELEKQGFSKDNVDYMRFYAFNQDLLIGYDKLRQDAEKEILPKLEGIERAKAEDKLRQLSNVNYRTKSWRNDFTISHELRDAAENGRKLTREEADQSVSFRNYSDQTLKEGWYDPDHKRFYFDEKYVRKGAKREAEKARLLEHFQKYLWNTYDISVNLENEASEKEAMQKHARFFEEKKNIPPKHRKKMRELTELLKSHFKGVELDEDVDLDKIDKLTPEIKAITDQLPLAANGKKATLRFRKLGTTALGKFTKLNNTIAVDPRDFGKGNVGIQSYLHEYGHYLDLNQEGLPLSMQSDFRSFSSDVQSEIWRNPLIDPKESKYLATSTEMFARGFEKSLAELGVKGNFIDDAKTYESSPRYDYGEKLNEKQMDYFKSRGIEEIANNIKNALKRLDLKEEKKQEKKKGPVLEEKVPQHYEQLSLDLFPDEQQAQEIVQMDQDQLDTEKWRQQDMKKRWGEEKLEGLRASENYGDKILLAEHGNEKDLDKLVNDPDEDVRYAVAWRGRPKDLDKLVFDRYIAVRAAVAKQGRDKDLDKLVSDKEPAVRAAVADQGRDQDLDKLVSDEETLVRSNVAMQGRDKDLDKLVNDKEWNVRRHVAAYGRDQDLDKLVNDPEWDVRLNVAKQGRDKDLDKLVSDPEWSVRSIVAAHGRDKDLDKLVNDPDEEVRQFAEQQIREKDLDNLTEMSKSGLLDQKFLLLKDIGAVNWPDDTGNLEAIAKQLPKWREEADEDPKARVKLAAFGRDKDLDKIMAKSDNGWRVREAVAMRGRDQDLDKLVSDPAVLVRSEVAKHGRDKDLDKLVGDSDWGVRRSVAEQGRDKDLDKLVSDKNKWVRVTVARQERDKDLDKLVSDPDYNVRSSVANQGRDKDLDKLVSDKDPAVRAAVAKQGRDQDLDKLVGDKNTWVRQAVADQGRDKDLDRLVNDPNWDVRGSVASQGRDQDLDKLVFDKDEHVREAVAGQGRDKDLDKLVNDKNDFVLTAVVKQGRDQDLDKLVSSPSQIARAAVAEHGRNKDLDKLVDDKDPMVRVTVATFGRDQDLDKLVSDEEFRVRSAVAEHGRDKDLDKLVFDKDEDVREAVAKQGRDQDLDKLVGDKSKFVRAAVAGQGRDKDLDKLVNDKDGLVREAVADQGRDKDLDRLVNDPDKGVRMNVAYQKRDQDLDKLVGDKEPAVRAAVADQGRDKDLDKLVRDRAAGVRMAVAEKGREKDLEALKNDRNIVIQHDAEKGLETIFARRREAARRGLER